MRMALYLFLFSLCAASTSAAEPGFTVIFDGKTFTGWEGDTKKTFRIENEAVVAGSLKQRVPHNEFLCTTKEYGDFELRLKAKVSGQGKNAGVQFRSARIPNHHEVKGYQCDVGWLRKKPCWGWLYDESRRRKFLAEANSQELLKVLKQNDWNELVVRCEGAHIQIWVNGYQTVNYTEKEENISRRGIIGLQIHSGLPTEVFYKEIRIKEL